jgi:phage portal protein BeeE
MKNNNKEVGIVYSDDNTDEPEDNKKYLKVVFKDVDPDKEKIKKDVTIGLEGEDISNIQYAEHPIAMDKLYSLYIEDETIGAGIDKTSKVASSEEITIGSKKEKGNEKNVEKAKEIIKQTYSTIKKTEQGITVKKKMMNKEFFKYLFTDFQIYANCYFEILRSIDNSEVVFLRKDPQKIYVLKDHLGYVEIDGLKKYYYNNYTPDKADRQNLRLDFKKGYIKGTDKLKKTSIRELVQIRDYGNPYYGVSALYSMAKSSLLQSNAKDLPNNMLGNGMTNTPVITFSGQSVPDAVKEEIETRFKYRATTIKNAGKPIVLYTTSPNSSVDIKGMPSHEFDLDQVKTMYKLGESNVIKRLGIPPEKLSILENSNKATITEAEATMTEEVINPLQSLFEFQMEIILNDDLKLDVTFKFADTFYNIEQMAKVSRNIKGVTTNEIRTLLFNFPKSDDPNADEILISRSDLGLSNLGEVSASTVQKDRIQVLKDIQKIRKSL